jgi:hypothetical protein
MAKQTFTSGQVLTAAQMTALQTNDYNQTVSAKTASYVLVAADAGTTITMSSATATTVTVNTSLFTAGDTLRIQNLNAGGTCTVTAGTATVTSAGSLIIPSWGGGVLYFTSTSAAVWFPNGVSGGLTRVTGGALSGATVLFSNAFSSTYDAYRIVVSNFTNTANAYVYMTLGSAATNYVNFQSAVTPAGAFSNTFGGQGTTRWVVAFTTTTDSGFSFDVINPNLAKRTTISGGLLVNGSTEAGTMVGTLNDTTQYTSFTLTANSGNFTGTVNVFGYSLS